MTVRTRSFINMFYIYREIREKVNVTFHPENNTVSYLQRRFWHFDESKSKGLLTDNITHLNVVAVVS